MTTLAPVQLHKRAAPLGIAALVLLGSALLVAGESAQVLPSTWPQPYSVRRDNAAGLLSLSTPYYAVQQDLHRGGAISSIRLAHGERAICWFTR